MIDYETYLQIHHLSQNEKLTQIQIAQKLHLHPDTVSKWLQSPRFPKRAGSSRSSKLDPFKRQIQFWLEAHPFSGAQILHKLQAIGYTGGKTILNDYLRRIRPRRLPSYLKLNFDPGECAQVDWGECGTISIGKTKRKLQVFVMVLCHSRLLFLRFYLSQSLECFLDGHVKAFEFFSGVPRRVMIDNLKTGVLEHRRGDLPNYHPRYLDLARHYGFSPTACAVGKGNEKGRVERGVGYIKNNFLGGRSITSLESLQAAGEQWRDQIANQRCHGTTKESPLQRFQDEEKETLLPGRIESYDCSVVKQAGLSKDCRVKFETNTYSVPPGQTSGQLTLRVEAERIVISKTLTSEPIAIHPRCYDRHKDNEDPNHTEQLKANRRQAREQNLLHDFRQLGPVAVRFYNALKEKQVDYRSQIRQLLTLVSIYGNEEMERALRDALEENAIHAAYIENLLTVRAREVPEASPLHLTRNEDQLDLDSPQANLEIYENPRQPKRPKA